MLDSEPLQREQVKQLSSGLRPRFPRLWRAETTGTRGQRDFRESDRQRQPVSSQPEREGPGSFSPSYRLSILRPPSPLAIRQRPRQRGGKPAAPGTPKPGPGAAAAWSCTLADLASPFLLSAPSKPRGRHVFARKRTETLEATEADCCFVWFVLCAQGCWKTKLDMKSPELFEEEKGLGACRAGLGERGESQPKSSC